MKNVIIIGLIIITLIISGCTTVANNNTPAPIPTKEPVSIFTATPTLTPVTTSIITPVTTVPPSSKIYNIGESVIMNNLDISLTEIYMEKDIFNTENQLVLAVTITNEGNLNKEISYDLPPRDILFYIEDDGGKRYYPFTAKMSDRTWEYYLVPGETYHYLFYFSEGTPVKYARLNIESYEKDYENAKLRLMEREYFKLEK